MGKSFWVGWVPAALLAHAAAAELTPTEQRWLRGAEPVIAYARQASMPLDVIVQPDATPGAPPLGLAFVKGRCKLVLSMRGNPQVQAVQDSIDPALFDAALELMAAHELGHCRRYLDGAFYVFPAGFSAAVPQGLKPELQGRYLAMKATRLEEGFGDLVGLAWTQQRHPQHYAALFAWLLAERSADRIPGSHHDTLAWLRRVGAGFTGVGESIFAMSSAPWTAALDDAE